jgi:hypothetical protein
MDNKEPDTLPMFRAAPPATPDMIELVYCNRCGCCYTGRCSDPTHDKYTENKSLK